MTADVFRALLRFVHLVAAVTWIGGSLFYALVLRPQLRQETIPPEVRLAIAARYRTIVQACIAAFILTGVPLAFDRLSQSPSLMYAGLLWLKIVLSGAMLLLAYNLRVRRGRRPGPVQAPVRGCSTEDLILILGLLILLIVVALRVTYERALQ